MKILILLQHHEADCQLKSQTQALFDLDLKRRSLQHLTNGKHGETLQYVTMEEQMIILQKHEEFKHTINNKGVFLSDITLITQFRFITVQTPGGELPQCPFF